MPDLGACPVLDTGASRYRPNETCPGQRSGGTGFYILGPDFHREPWIPACAGMTILVEDGNA